METESKLTQSGLSTVAQPGSILPESDLTNRILDEQEELVENVLLTVSVQTRILSEIFPKKLDKYAVAVYDYDDHQVENVKLSDIANLLLHNRYVLVRGESIVDLLSSKEFLADSHQMGLKFKLYEYFEIVQAAASDITVNDLVGKLWALTKTLSPSSDNADILFLVQNLYTLGGFVVGTKLEVAGPVKAILDKVAAEYLSEAGQRQGFVTAVFGNPRFSLEQDLDQKKVKIRMLVNGQHRELIMDYEDFFQQVSEMAGDRPLMDN